MTLEEMIEIVQSQLAVDLNCTVEDLNGKKDEFVFRKAADNLGRRPFPRGEHHFEMLSLGKSIIISASSEILENIKPMLMGKSRDEAFSMPFIYGHGLNYLPDINLIKQLLPPEGFTFEFIEQDNISEFYHIDGFHNAIQYDSNSSRPDILLMIAKKGEKIIGMAGASNDCEILWQIGMDVLPEFRKNGLALYLVNMLTLEILSRGKIPYYCCSLSNIPSQRVAHRAGYFPAWINSYKGNFEGYDTLPIN